MIIAIGTTSERKIATVKKVLETMLQDIRFSIIPYSAISAVPETPWNHETYLGAKNRALDCQKNMTYTDYVIGIESGLVERYGDIYEEAWAYILDKEIKAYAGYSSGLKVPDYILKEMKTHTLPHSQIFAKINNHLDKDANSDTWGQYSGNILLREISIEEAVRNACIQIFAPAHSFFKK